MTTILSLSFQSSIKSLIIFYLVYIIAQLTVPFSVQKMISLHLSEKIMGQIMSIMIIERLVGIIKPQQIQIDYINKL